MASFNESEYKFEFVLFDETLEDERNPLYQVQSNNTFIISNTAITAQKSLIRNQSEENAVLIHSKYKKSEKIYWFIIHCCIGSLESDNDKEAKICWIHCRIGKSEGSLHS